MQIHVINTGTFKLDGGAMFGVVPKSIWAKQVPADENNLCTWAMRCLLIQTQGRNILIDTGLGNKQSAKFFSHYQPQGPDTLLNSLANLGLKPEDISDVLLTHLHFDHVGGAVSYDSAGRLVPSFPKATYWTTQKHWDLAKQPNVRERASFLPENFMPLEQAGVLAFLPSAEHDKILPWLSGIELQFAYGHTQAMILPHILLPSGRRLVYCADLLPSPAHLPLAYVMGYDTQPLQTLAEKEWFLDFALAEDCLLFFEHAAEVEACSLLRDERGRIVAGEQGLLSGFWSNV